MCKLSSLFALLLSHFFLYFAFALLKLSHSWKNKLQAVHTYEATVLCKNKLTAMSKPFSATDHSLHNSVCPQLVCGSMLVFIWLTNNNNMQFSVSACNPACLRVCVTSHGWTPYRALVDVGKIRQILCYKKQHIINSKKHTYTNYPVKKPDVQENLIMHQRPKDLSK